MVVLAYSGRIMYNRLPFEPHGIGIVHANSNSFPSGSDAGAPIPISFPLIPMPELPFQSPSLWFQSWSSNSDPPWVATNSARWADFAPLYNLNWVTPTHKLDAPQLVVTGSPRTSLPGGIRHLWFAFWC